ncbi:hypothetical protein [Nocardia fusca]|uniref:hypothetical protein n=1 Tax=Nocardia fusca TaxID=941183 RepID=UPI000A5D84E3|nr:hypothetical protein [Nocardia fusca]
MNSSPTNGSDDVPERLAGSPTAQGMAVPYITVAHRDRSRPVWGQLDPARLLTALVDRLCQICGQPLEDPAVLHLRPADYLRGITPEPATHQDCGAYSTRMCPMLAGQMQRYNPVVRDEFTRCDDPACGCRTWGRSEPDPNHTPREGQPAEAWYRVEIGLSDYRIITDPGNDHQPSIVGIDLRDLRFRSLHRIRDAAPGTGDRQPVDLLATLIVVRTLFGEGGVLS